MYGGTLTLEQQVATQYNVLNEPTSVTTTDEQPQSGEITTSVTVSYTYDDQGQMLTQLDPDQGTFTATYDPDGHVLSVTQTSGSNSRTVGYNYDLLGRTGCEQTAAPTINATGACSAGSPLVQNTYDTNELGTQGSTDFPVGQLTRSVATTYYPDSTSATVTEQAQYDQRGRPITGQIQLGVPSSWGLTTTLPTYQLSQVYNDADQPTTTTISSSDGNADYTFTPIYDSTNGVEQGLSNNSSSTANLATIAYNEFAQLASITYLPPAGTSGTTLAEEQFGYDGDLRPISEQATWLPGSGNSGTILDQSLTYDNAGNVTGETTQMASVPGQSGSGGSETQNFCYDEQNRMVWAGDGGTQPGAGNGTCGSGTLSNSLSGAGYTSSYVFTNLGQIWQGPLNNSTTQYQYLYCNNNPHELTGVYPIGTTCSNRSGATPVYSASYDPWGNETSRTYNGVTETLSYDAFNDLVEESGTNSTQEQYVYDASGERVLKRSTSGSVTTLTVEAFSSQELTYSSSGVFSSQADYYGFGPLLIGATNGSSTTYYLTDTQGNVLTSFSAVASSAAGQGNQLYSPYGTQRYQQGSTGPDQ